MNLILALVLFVILLMGVGVPEPTTTVRSVTECVVAADATDRTCPEDAPPSPAAQAGLHPGDTILAVNGEATPSWPVANNVIRDTIGPAEIEVRRDGETLTLETELIENQVVARDADGDVVVKTGADGEPVVDDQGYEIPATETTGFLGITFQQERRSLTAGETAVHMGDTMVGVGMALVKLPSKVDDVFRAAFLGEERTVDSPVGIVGASRIGGEVLAQPIPLTDRVVFMLNMLAGVNLFLFALNMVPILPLDGGHILGSVWEAIRRRVARIFQRPDPGPFDVAKLMPFAYIVVACFLVFSVMLLVADVVNPVRLTQ